MARIVPLVVAAGVFLAGCAAQAPRPDDVFAHVDRGMTKEEVRRIAGVPHETMPFPRLGQDSWGWYAWDRFGYYSLFSVTFGPDGRVASTFTRRLNDGGNMQ